MEQVAPFSLYNVRQALSDTKGYILQQHSAASELAKSLQKSTSVPYVT